MPEEEREYCICEQCEEPIMVGYDYYDTQDGKVHEDCFEEFAKKKLEAKMCIAGDEY